MIAAVLATLVQVIVLALPVAAAVNALTALPNGDGTTTGWVQSTGCTSTTKWDCLDEGIVTADGDTTVVDGPNRTAGQMYVDMSDMPADFVAAKSVEIRARHRLLRSADDTMAAWYGIFAADEATALTAEASVGNLPASFTNWSAQPSISGGTDKAAWDSARLRIRQSAPNNVASADTTTRARITAVEVVVTYLSTGGRMSQTGFVFENDDEDEVGTDAFDDNTQQGAGGTAATDVRPGERLNLRLQIRNTGASMNGAEAALFYDRNDGLWTRVKARSPAVTDAGTGCSDTGYDCSTVDSGGDVGRNTSVVIDGNASPWVAYQDTTNLDLRVARYVGSRGTGCASPAWTCMTVESTGSMGTRPSIGMDSHGNVWVSHHDATNGDLRVARYVGTGGTGCATTTWACAAVDTTGTVGDFSALTLDGSGNPWVSYYDTTNGDLRVARYVGGGTGAGCASTDWSCTTVDSGNDVGRHTTVAFDPSGNAWVGYHDTTGADVRVARHVGSSGSGCTSAQWSCETVETAGATGADGTSIAFDPSGKALVSYYESGAADLRIARHVATGGTGCASVAWTCTAVDTTGDVGRQSTAGFDVSGKPWVAYRDVTNGSVRVARNSSGTGCATSAWTCTALGAGEHPSLAFDPDGRPWMTFYDSATADLRVADLRRSGEIGIALSAAGRHGDPLQESHSDMTSSSDTANRDDADCIGGGTWNQGVFTAANHVTLPLPDGSVTAQCTEVGFTLDTSGGAAGATYRFVLATKDSWRPDKEVWRGPVSVSAFPAITMAASTFRLSKDAVSKMANCTDASWGCLLLESTGDVGVRPSVAMDLAGRPWITHRNGTNSGLKLARYVGSGGAGCLTAAWDCYMLDNTVNAGEDSSLAFDPTGNPWASYWASSTGDLRVARYVGAGGSGCTSSAWTCVTVESANTVGRVTSIAFDPSGTAWVSHWDSTNGDLRVARYVGSGGTGCAVTSWTCVAVDTAGTVGGGGNLAIDPSGNPWVSYYDATNADLRVARYVGMDGSGCASPQWSCETVESLNNVGNTTGIIIGTDGKPWVAHQDTTNGDLRLSQYVGSGGTGCAIPSWNCEAVDTVGTVGKHVGIALDPLGRPWVSSYDGTNADLKLARYVGSGGTGCAVATWTCTTVDATGSVGDFTSLAFDHQGVPWIGYRHAGSLDFKVAKLHEPVAAPAAATGFLGRSAPRSDGRYRGDHGDTARPVAGGCDAAAGRTGYCGIAAQDTFSDSVTAQADEVAMFSATSTFADNTGGLVATWRGRSSAAPSTQALTLEIWRAGTVNGWTAVTLSQDTCASTVADTDCVMSGEVTTNLGDYYLPSGSRYLAHTRVRQAAGTAAGTLFTDAYSLKSQANSPPGSPVSLDQRTVGGASLAVGAWHNSGSITLAGSVSDPDSSDTLSLCVEVDALGTAFSGVEDACGTGVTYSGTAVTASVPRTLAEGQYHWQARVKDTAGAYSSWVSFGGGNAESARDLGVDTTAPGAGTVYDGSSAGVDVTVNDGSLTSLSANWEGFSDALSGLGSYDYAVGTTPGGTEVLGWTGNGLTTSATPTGLSLATSVGYYVSVRAVDGAGNTITATSNGQTVAPTLNLTVSGVAASTACGEVTTTVATSAGSFPLGRLTSLAQRAVAGQNVTVTTNAANGYTVYLSTTGAVTGGTTGRSYTDTPGTNASPAAWPASGTEAVGYTTSSTTLSGTANRFAGGLWAAFTTSLGEILHGTGPTTAGTTSCIATAASMAGNTATDTYTTTVRYTTAAAY